MDADNDEVVAVAPVAPETDSSPFSYLKHVLRQKAALPPGGRFEARVKVRAQPSDLSAVLGWPLVREVSSF